MARDGLPSGTVTFLFTDLIDSTRQWEDDEDAMRAAVARHDALVRAAVEASDGYLVKRTGDGAMAAFHRAEDAASAAAAVQRAMAAEAWTMPLAARIGLHTGDATPAEGDYQAPAVNRAARVAGAAHGGQVLLSPATATLLPPTASVDLGAQRLKGLPLIHLHQLLAEGLRSDFPALTTRTHAAGTPPRSATTFVGREADLALVPELLATHRLVTLTGAGGSGKTRLAIEVADRSPGRVAFVDLAPVAVDDDVATAIADSLGLAGSLDGHVALRVRDYLASQEVLCVLDNCEHVVDPVAALVTEVLARGGGSRLLATSREPLGVVGEQVFAVASLPVDTEAVELFVNRATEVRPTFALHDGNQDEVAEICRRLDGLPLAIELAAARTAHLSTSQLLQRLDDRFRLLTGGRRRIARHQTLAATLDWSHDLLDPDEQVMLRRLSAFPATFTLEAAESLAEVEQPLDVLASLVDKSLVQDVPQPDGSLRYRLLETVRLYAGEKAAVAGETAAVHQAHRDLAQAWLEAKPLEERWFADRDVLAEERASLRAALQWSADKGDVVSLATLASGVDWSRSADYHDGVRWCDDALEASEALPPDLRDRLLVARVAVSQVESRGWALPRTSEAHDALNAAEPTLRAVAGVWRCLWRLFDLDGGPGDEALAAEVSAWVEEAVELSSSGSPPWRMYCRLLAGYTYLGMGAAESILHERGEAHVRAGLADGATLSGYDGLTGGLEETLAIHALVHGDAAEALRLATHHVETPITPMLGHRLRLVEARALAALGRYDEGLEVVRHALAAMRSADVVGGDETAALTAGGLAVIMQDWEVAARLLHTGRARFNRTPLVAFLYIREQAMVREHLPRERRHALRDEGRVLGPAQALDRYLDR